jgi:hypothetical protein
MILKAKLICISKFLSSVCFSIILKINFTNSFPVVEKRLIGHKFWRYFGFLLGFGRVIMISASF